MALLPAMLCLTRQGSDACRRQVLRASMQEAADLGFDTGLDDADTFGGRFGDDVSAMVNRMKLVRPGAGVMNVPSVGISKINFY